jgi:hypothetical protein
MFAVGLAFAQSTTLSLKATTVQLLDSAPFVTNKKTTVVPWPRSSAHSKYQERINGIVQHQLHCNSAAVNSQAYAIKVWLQAQC